MEKIGLKELNQQTSKVASRVRNGEHLMVTDHGRDVMMLVPVTQESLYERMIKAGQVRMAPRTGSLTVNPVESSESTAEILASDREDRI